MRRIMPTAACMLAMLLSFSACGQRIKGISMPEDRLVPILLDVHLAEAALQNVHGTTKDSLTTLYLKQICEIHNIEQRKLEEVLEELRNNPEAMERVYLKVVEKVESRNR